MSTDRKKAAEELMNFYVDFDVFFTLSRSSKRSISKLVCLCRHSWTVPYDIQHPHIVDFTSRKIFLSAISIQFIMRSTKQTRANPFLLHISSSATRYISFTWVRKLSFVSIYWEEVFNDQKEASRIGLYMKSFCWLFGKNPAKLKMSNSLEENLITRGIVGSLIPSIIHWIFQTEACLKSLAFKYISRFFRWINFRCHSSAEGRAEKFRDVKSIICEDDVCEGEMIVSGEILRRIFPFPSHLCTYWKSEWNMLSEAKRFAVLCAINEWRQNLRIFLLVMLM